MSAIHAQYWCEFAASLAVAAVAWGVGYRLLIRDDGDKPQIDNNTRAGQADGDSTNADDKERTDFLREAVRLTEERIREQDAFTRFIQWKAALLGALSIFTAAFLFSGGFDAKGALPMTALSGALSVLSAAFCAKTLNLDWHGMAGFHAPDILVRVESLRKGDIADMLRVVLKAYHDSIAVNDATNEKKTRHIERAKKLWMWGAGAALGAMAGNSPLSEWACRLAA